MQLSQPTPYIDLARQRGEHMALLHPYGSAGRPFVGRRHPDGELTGKVCSYEIAWELAEDEGTYVSLNGFRGNSRSTENLRRVGNLMLDLDYHRDDLPHRHATAATVATMAVDALVAAGVPRPSIDVGTGRGVQLQWACDGAHKGALPRIAAIYDALYGPLDVDGNVVRRRGYTPTAEDLAYEERMLPLWRTLYDLGLDRNCRDASRICRLVGSWNAKSDSVAELLFPSQIRDAVRYDLDTLVAAILPYTPAEIAARRAARAEAKAARPVMDSTTLRRSRPFDAAGYWSDVEGDLHRLREHRGKLDVGVRNTWLFLTANASCHVKGTGQIAQWSEELAPLAGLTAKEARSSLGTLNKRARRHQAGELVQYDKRNWTPLYHYSAARMCELLDISASEAKVAGLRRLVPGGGASRTQAQRQAEYRIRKGATPRAVAAEEFLSDGLMALALQEAGWRLADIAPVVKRSRSVLVRAMAAARAYEPGIKAEQAHETGLVALSPMVDRAREGAGRQAQVGERAPAREAKPVRLPPPATTVHPGQVRVTRYSAYAALVETATGSWTWMPSDPFADPREPEKARLARLVAERLDWLTLDHGCRPSPADTALAEAAGAELSRATMAAIPVRTPKARPRPSMRPTASRMPSMAWRVETADNLYLRDSRGW